MRAERLGSYSIASTFAGTLNLLRLKSIIRYKRLCPPPMIRSDATGVVPSATVVQRVAQAFFRPRLGHLVKSKARAKAYSCRGWVVSFNRHD